MAPPAATEAPISEMPGLVKAYCEDWGLTVTALYREAGRSGVPDSLVKCFSAWISRDDVAAAFQPTCVGWHSPNTPAGPRQLRANAA